MTLAAAAAKRVRTSETAPRFLLAAIVLVALLASQLSPYDPTLNQYQKLVQEPSAEHIMGTDKLGRDVFSRLLYGARISLVVAFTAVLLGELLGFVVGVATAYVGGRFDLVSQRLVDVLMSFPTLILAMLLMVSLGAGLLTVVVAIGISQVPLATRITRSVVLATKETAYVEAARCIGASPARIMVRHIALQCVAPLLVIATVNLGAAIFAEASLSFLGVGTPPPNPSWGIMLSGAAQQFIRVAPWMAIFPGVAISLVVLAFNLLGDALRDMLVPHLR